jgi:hypothetical protein
MLQDIKLAFVPVGSPLAITNASVRSPQIYDIVGAGPGTPPANIIGNAATFGSDLGVAMRMYINILVGAGFTTADAATLNVAFQGAQDTGLAGGFQPGAWQTFDETGVMTAAQLLPGTQVRLNWPTAFPASFQPRFISLLFQVPAGLAFTGGTISSALVSDGRDDNAQKYAARNFSV